MIVVAGSDNAITSREAATEILALQVFNYADRAGVVVTRKLTDERLAEHAAGCDCGICELVQLAAPSKVYWMASR